MAVVFCLDDNQKYVLLLKVAVRSLRVLHPEMPIFCIYAGSNQEIVDDVRAEGINLVLYRPYLTPDKIPVAHHGCMGCYLKMELALVPELAGYDNLLYCDCDTLFLKPIDEFLLQPVNYLGMAKEQTAPFFHEYEQLSYTWRDRAYIVPMPFPIWTYNSGVVLFNLKRLRSHDLIHNFLAFSEQNLERIGNLDQSLLNYYFGKRITKLDEKWNSGAYRYNALNLAGILHFHGPNPWDIYKPHYAYLRINDYEPARQVWKSFLTNHENEMVNEWEQEQKSAYSK